MIPVSNRPIIAHTVDSLISLGFNRILIASTCFSNEIKSCFAEYPDVTVLEIPANGGASDTLLAAKGLVEGDFLVLYGDVLLAQCDLKDFIEGYTAKTFNALLAPLHTEHTGSHICCNTAHRKVIHITGHPRGGHAYKVCGFVFNKDIFPLLEHCPDYFPVVEVGMMPSKERYIESCLVNYINNNPLYAYICKEQTCDLDKPWHILMANKALNEIRCKALSQNVLAEGAVIDKTAVINGFVQLGKNSRVGTNVILEGNCIIGDNTEVTNGAILRPNVVIGDHCYVANYCYVSEGSTIGNRCVVNHCAELDGILFENVYLYHYMEMFGIIGCNTDIGAATVCGSLRFDDGETVINVNGRREIPGGYSNATFLGDFCRTGVNVVISPGRRIGPYSIIGAGTLLNEDVPNNTLIYPKQELVKKSWGSNRYGW